MAYLEARIRIFPVFLLEINPLGSDLPQFLQYPFCLVIPKACNNVEDIAALLFGRDAPYIAHLLQGNHIINAAGRRIITNLKPEGRDNVYRFLYPEEYAVGENPESDSHSNTSEEEDREEDVDEEEDEQGEAELQCFSSHGNFIKSRRKFSNKFIYCLYLFAKGYFLNSKTSSHFFNLFHVTPPFPSFSLDDPALKPFFSRDPHPNPTRAPPNLVKMNSPLFSHCVNVAF